MKPFFWFTPCYVFYETNSKFSLSLSLDVGVGGGGGLLVSVERVMKELACATPAPPRVTSSGGTCAQKRANMSSPATASALHVKGWLQASERPSVQVQRSWNSCAHAARRRAQGRLASKRGKCKEKQVLKFILTKGSWKMRREMRGEADAMTLKQKMQMTLKQKQVMEKGPIS